MSEPLTESRSPHNPAGTPQRPSRKEYGLPPRPHRIRTPEVAHEWFAQLDPEERGLIILEAFARTIPSHRGSGDARQTERILEHLRAGRSISPLEALSLFGCFRLGARIKELRDRGIKIRTVMETTRTGKRIARYSLENGVSNGQG